MTVAVKDLRTEAADRIADYVAESVANSTVFSSPFQHFATQNILPPDVYSQLRANMPPHSAYRPLNIKRWKNAEGKSTRDRILLNEGEIGSIPAEIRQLWADVAEALASSKVQRAVYSQLKKDIARRLKCDAQEVASHTGFTSIILTRDFQDYELKPHPDGWPRVVTMMLYLADPEQPTDLGTSIYREKPILNRVFGGRFEEVYRFPYLPNSAGTFAVNELPNYKSWHGRELVQGSSTVRDSIIVSYLAEHTPTFGTKHY